ncbi:MAG: Hypothetical NagD-like phosphatase, Actinobacterial subfamily, partial [uncultured Nocardioidaceae bacterium]
DLRQALRLLAHGHGRRAGARGDADPRCPGVRRHPQGVGATVPGADQQLHLHPPGPALAAPRQRDRRARGVDLDLCPRHGAVPGRAAAGRVGVRRGRGGAHHRPPRRRLRDDRPGSRLRGARRDPDVLVRGDHPGHPVGRRRGPVPGHEPGHQRTQPARQAAGDRLGGGVDQHRDGTAALLHRQAQPVDDAQRPQPARRALGDGRDDRRPHGHRHHQRPRGRHADHPRRHRVHASRRGQGLPLPAHLDGSLHRRPDRARLEDRPGGHRVPAL